jgi:hypothetical protein
LKLNSEDKVPTPKQEQESTTPNDANVHVDPVEHLPDHTMDEPTDEESCTVSCTETGTAARSSTQDTRKIHLAAVPVSVQDTLQPKTWYKKKFPSSQK